MSSARNPTRPHLWMDTMGDWSWPGQGAAAAAEALPPSWVPAFPPRREPVTAPAPAAGRRRARRLLLGVLLSSLAAVCGGLAAQGQLNPSALLRLGSRPAGADSRAPRSPSPTLPPPPTLTALSTDAAGSSIDRAEYASAALRRRGSFYVYLPPGYATTPRHSPVLSLLHGNSQPATAFLDLGLQEELDRQIARKDFPPMIAVMIQGG